MNRGSAFYHHHSTLKTDTSAFTLIEVLVSLALLTIVLGAVYSAFFSVQRALERFDSVSLIYHEARTSLDMIRREIEGALVKNPKAKDGEKVKASFIIKDRDMFGENTSMLELTAFSFRGNSLITTSYFVDAGEHSLSLMKHEAPPGLAGDGYTLEMIEGVKSFTIETLFNGKWVRTWDTDNTEKLPEVVRITIEFNDNGKPVTLTEYARPRIGTHL